MISSAGMFGGRGDEGGCNGNILVHASENLLGTNTFREFHSVFTLNQTEDSPSLNMHFPKYSLRMSKVRRLGKHCIP